MRSGLKYLTDYGLKISLIFSNVLVTETVPQLLGIPNADFGIINIFSGCLINVINFRGLDINFKFLKNLESDDCVFRKQLR